MPALCVKTISTELLVCRVFGKALLDICQMPGYATAMPLACNFILLLSQSISSKKRVDGFIVLLSSNVHDTPDLVWFESFKLPYAQGSGETVAAYAHPLERINCQPSVGYQGAHLSMQSHIT